MIGSQRWTGSGLGLVAAGVLGLGLLVVPARLPSAGAQDEGGPPHPAHIHTGTCETLGDVALPLGEIGRPAAGEARGAAAAVPVASSDSEVDLPFGLLLDGQFAINVHRSAEQIDDYIACGEIGGLVDDGRLVMGLRELNGSGYAGVAILEEDGDETDVTVHLLEPAGGAATAPAADAAATAPPAAEVPATEPPAAEVPATQPPATEVAATVPPAAAAPAGQSVGVDIRNFAFNPNPIAINVGDTVTWTNRDEVPHTATANDRSVLQSGAIVPGASFSQTFAAAGEFPYFCEFHPNMQGTIVVQ